MHPSSDVPPSIAASIDLPPLTALTARQREVAAFVAEGLMNEEIAERLVLTPGTVGNHVAHIMRKLGARNRVQVAVWAVAQGLHHPQPGGGGAAAAG